MPTYVFEEVKLYASKSGICPVCGKRATRNQKFQQTINPFNKTKDGIVKTSSEIRPELRQAADAWRLLPTYHSKCEP